MPEPTYLTVGPDEPGNEEFGKLLEEFRKNANLSRAQAADILGLSYEYLRLVERGRRVPALGNIGNILSLYRVMHDVGLDYVSFGSYIVEFTSRIQKTRGNSTPVTVEERDRRIGQIMRLLVTVDDGMLQDIYKRLRRGA